MKLLFKSSLHESLKKSKTAYAMKMLDEVVFSQLETHLPKDRFGMKMLQIPFNKIGQP